MTKPIEDALNLPRLSDVLKETEPSEEQFDIGEDIPGPHVALENIRNVLENMSPESVLGNDSNITEIKDEALSSYKAMIDAGFACDSKHASNFLEPAVQALSIALDSEKTRANKKIEYYRLKLQQEKLELARRKIELEERRLGQNAEIIDGDSVLIDRNELLRQLFKKDE